MIKNNFDDIYYPNNLDEILYKNVDEKMIDHIRRANKDYLLDVSMTFLGEKSTYKEMFDNMQKYSKSLKKYGISKGDYITIVMPNIPETICYFYALNDIGAIPYLVDPRNTFNNILECINNSNSKLLICELETYYKKIYSNLDKLPLDNVVVVSPVNFLNNKKNINNNALIAKSLYLIKENLYKLKYERQSTKTINQIDFLKLHSQYEGNYCENYDPEIPAIVVNTSGTTGNFVKGAVHSNKSYNIFTNQIPLITKHLNRGNTYHGYIPFFTMYGSCVGMHTALSNGIIIDNIPVFKGKKSIEEIIKKEPNILIGFPSLVEKIADLCEKRNIDTSFMKQYVIGGDNISPEKLKKENDILLSRGMKSKLIFGYGSTETMPISTTSFDERSQVPGSTGYPYPGVSVKIINPNTNEECDYNEEGEICVHTPNMMLGYLNLPDENKKSFKIIDNIKYIKTGDKGYLTCKGILFVTGRYKRLMKRPDCHQVSSIPLENAVNSSPLVLDCAVVGIKNRGVNQGVIPTAFIVLNNDALCDSKKSEEEIITIIANNTLKNSNGERDIPLAYVVVDSLPMTINGKVDFVKLEHYYFEDINNYYIIDDVINKYYFGDISSMKVIKLTKEKNLSLKKGKNML